MRRWVTALLTVAVMMSACANRHSVPSNKPIIRRIAIIPASNPTWYSFENAPPLAVAAMGGLGDLSYKLNSKSKAKAFNNVLLSQPSTLGTDFTAEVAAALRAAGFTVDVLQGVKRPPDDPDNVDFAGISSDADAILNLWISEVGLYSSMLSRDHVPRLNAFGKLVVKGRKDSIYDEEIDYGVDAKKESKLGIVADPKFAYPSFDAVMSNIDEIRKSFGIGTLQISERLSEQIANSPNYLKGATESRPVP